MTSRGVLLSVLVFLLALAGLATRQGAVFALALPLLVYLGLAAWRRPAGLQLSARRELDQTKISAGAPVETRVTIHNPAPAIEELVIFAGAPPGLSLEAGENQALTTLARDEAIELVYSLQGGRGEYSFGEVKARAKETFGLFETTAAFPAAAGLTVLPSALKMRPVQIRPPHTHGFAGPIPSRQGGAGVEFLLVREYQPGDPLRQVNWKISARSERELYTTAYELQRIADVGILLDARQQIDTWQGGARLFEYSVQAAGGLADLFLQDGNRVGLLVYGAALSSAFPGTGKLQRERIRQVLARAETGFSYALERLDYIPTRFFPPRSQIILVSPLMSADVPVLGYLHQQGYAVLVVSPNPVLFESGPAANNSVDFLTLRASLAERNLMINTLRRHGVQVIDWDVSAPLEPLLRVAVAAAVRRPVEVGG